MNTKTPIKIVKRGDRNRPQEAAVEETTPAKKTTQQTARDMVATVSEWVTEFQQKRRMETTQAIKTLLADRTAHTSKA
jgi:uncharacterized membrane-anchored protein